MFTNYLTRRYFHSTLSQLERSGRRRVSRLNDKNISRLTSQEFISKQEIDDTTTPYRSNSDIQQRNVSEIAIPSEINQPIKTYYQRQKNNDDVISTMRTVDEDPEANWYVTGNDQQEQEMLQRIHKKELRNDHDLPLWLRLSTQREGDTRQSHQKQDESNLQNNPTSIANRIRNEDGSLNVGHIKEYLEGELRAEDVRVLDVRGRCSWTDFMIICSTNSISSVTRLSESFYQMAKKNTLVGKEQDNITEDELLDSRLNRSIPAHRLAIEGKDNDDWKLVDLGSSVVHFFTREARDQYALEELWDASSLSEDTINDNK